MYEFELLVPAEEAIFITRPKVTFAAHSPFLFDNTTLFKDKLNLGSSYDISIRLIGGGNYRNCIKNENHNWCIIIYVFRLMQGYIVAIQWPSGQGNGLVAGVSRVRAAKDPSCRGSHCTLNLCRLKRPSVSVVWKLGERGVGSGHCTMVQNDEVHRQKPSSS
ncbi:hypothetical protein TNCV_2231161 [Trichonephila clavipes]|nr:hypothetical protein TNCV_2231161 [Trichonephila clavipes]